MGMSFTVFIVVIIIVILLAGLISLGLTMWQSTPEVETQSYILTVGNGFEQFFTTSPIEYPYFKIGTERSATYYYRIPMSTPVDPLLPILATLPTNATNLTGHLVYSSLGLPVGETGLSIVQYGPNTVAMQYQPSGTFAKGGELTSDWTLIYTVTYTFV